MKIIIYVIIFLIVFMFLRMFRRLRQAGSEGTKKSGKYKNIEEADYREIDSNTKKKDQME